MSCGNCCTAVMGWCYTPHFLNPLSASVASEKLVVWYRGVRPSTCEAFQVWDLPGVMPSRCETFHVWDLPDVSTSRCAFDQNLHPVTPVSSFSEGEPRSDKISKLYKPRINPTAVVEVNPCLRSKVKQNSSLGYFYADSQKYLVHTLTFEKQT